MNVTSIGQGPGATVPGPQTGDNVALLSRGETRVAAVAPQPRRGSDLDAAFARVAWFDVNGDGHIDNRSPLAGGDGTLLVPKHAVGVQTYSHEVRRQQMRSTPQVDTRSTADDGAATAKTSGGEANVVVSPSGSNDVQTRQAIDAYQRYGQPQETAPTERAVA